MSWSARARLFAATSRPTIATALWACGWCGGPPALPDLWSLGAASAARLFARVARAIFWFLRPEQQHVQLMPAQSPGISVAHVDDPALHAGVTFRLTRLTPKTRQARRAPAQSRGDCGKSIALRVSHK